MDADLFTPLQEGRPSAFHAAPCSRLVSSANVDVDSRAESALCPTPSSASTLSGEAVNPVEDPIESELGTPSVTEAPRGSANPELDENQIHRSRWILGLPLDCPEFRERSEKSDIGRRHLAVALRWQALGRPDPVISLVGRYDEEWVPEAEAWLDSLEQGIFQQNVDVDSRAESALCPAASSRIS